MHLDEESARRSARYEPGSPGGEITAREFAMYLRPRTDAWRDLFILNGPVGLIRKPMLPDSATATAASSRRGLRRRGRAEGSRRPGCGSSRRLLVEAARPVSPRGHTADWRTHVFLARPGEDRALGTEEIAGPAGGRSKSSQARPRRLYRERAFWRYARPTRCRARAALWRTNDVSVPGRCREASGAAFITARARFSAS
jgi:hypothetical protein